MQLAQSNSEPTLLVAVEDHVATMALNRPKRRNSMSGRLVHDLIDHLQRADADPNVRAIVLVGQGQGFCAGSDLRELAAMAPADQRRFEEQSALAARMLQQSSKPTIAAVHGFAIGGGLTLAAACDFVVAAPDSVWALPEVPIGLFPAWGLEAVAARVGWIKARQLSFGHASWDGRQALAAGLVDQIADGEVRDAALQIATGLSALPQAQVAAVKAFFDHSVEGQMSDDRAAASFMRTIDTPEAVSTLVKFGRKA